MKAVVNYVRLKSAAAFSQLAASVSYVSLRVTTQLGDFIKNFFPQELLRAVDLASKLLTKSRTDVAAATDSAAKSTSKSRSDAAAALDAPAKEIAKALASAGVTTDEHLRSFTKGLTELVTATDDLNGASADDDQIIQFFKVTNEAAAAVDVIAIVTQFTRTFGDGANTAEVVGKVITKAFDDLVAATDAIAISRGADQNVLEFTAVVDVLERSLQRALSDAATVTDSVDKSALKSFASGAGTQDQSEKNFNKSASDTASTSDAGFVRSQGYSDFDYFAEDYVGASRTF